MRKCDLKTSVRSVGESELGKFKPFTTEIDHFQEAMLVIEKQPVEEFRFRYTTEMNGTHGSLMSRQHRNEDKEKKSYPKVTLKGYPGVAVIRCTLYQENLEDPSPHSHSLVRRSKNGEDLIDPHYFEVGHNDAYTLSCQGMGIIHTSKKDIGKALRAKLEALWQKKEHAELGPEKRKEFKEKAEREEKNMNLNKVN